MALTPVSSEDVNQPGPALDRHYHELEAAVLKATGASACAVFCHARRSTFQEGSAMQPFAYYVRASSVPFTPDDLPPMCML